MTNMWKSVVSGLLILIISFIFIEIKTHNHFKNSFNHKIEISQKKDFVKDSANCLICIYHLNTKLQFPLRRFFLKLILERKHFSVEFIFYKISTFIRMLLSRSPPNVY